MTCKLIVLWILNRQAKIFLRILKAPFIVYTDLECLLKKILSCQNNLENSYKETKAKHKPSGYTSCSICSFNDTKSKHYFYKGKDCIEKFCKDLKELGTEIINFK